MKNFVNKAKELYKMGLPIFRNLSAAGPRQSVKAYPMFLKKKKKSFKDISTAHV